MDIAKLGFQVDTSDLADATIELNKIIPAAKGAQKATDDLAKATEKGALSAAKLAHAAAKEQTALTKAALASARASEQATKEDIKSASQAYRKAKAVQAVAAAEVDRVKKIQASIRAEKDLQRVSEATTVAMRKEDAALRSVAAGLSGRGGGGRSGIVGGRTPANDLMPNRFNTANIAAQFQDIGVTAAMGMNPMTIALQQGTQLSAIINSMESPLAGIAEAFQSIINPVSLLSIGLVGLIAVGVQLTDWVAVGKYALNGLADAVENLTPYILGLAATFVVLNIGAVATGVYTLVSSLVTLGATALATGAKMAYAWALANPVTALGLAFTTVLMIAYQFRDELTKLLGVDIFEAAKKGVNAIAGAFVGTYNGIVAVWSQLPAAIGDIMTRTANDILKKFEKLINDYIWASNTFLRTSFGDVHFTELENNFEGAAANVASIMTDEINKGMKEVDIVTPIGDGIGKASKMAADKLRSLAEGLGVEEGAEGGKKGGKTEADRYEDIVKGAERRIASLKAEQAALTLTSFETAKLKHHTDLLNEAQQKNINLIPDQKTELENLATTMATIEEQTKKVKEAIDLMRDVGKSFFTDLRSGLMEGKGLWQSFADAAVNALNRIMDKFFDSALDDVFNNLFSSGAVGGSGSGGILDSIVGLFSAKGNVFNSGGVTAFAKGGAFTNGVYSKPTMFAFGNGGAFGVMGEAGPEAVLPLHRGSDGSLGVKVEGGTGQDGMNVVINNYSSAQVSSVSKSPSGKSIEILIDEGVARSINKPGSQGYQAVKNFGTNPMSKG